MLQITRNECSRILQRSKIRELEIHLQMLEERLEEVHELKRKIQELKIWKKLENGQVDMKPKFRSMMLQQKNFKTEQWN